MNDLGRRTVRALGAAAFCAGTLTWQAGPASAHDELVGSTPVDGARVSEVPSVIRLRFEEAPVAGYTAVTVLDPQGATVNSGAISSDGAVISVHLRHASVAGAYRVRFHILSDDGHAVDGVVRFRVTGGGEHAAPAPDNARPKGEDSRSLGPVVAAASVLVLGSGAFALHARRRTTRRVASFGRQ